MLFHRALAVLTSVPQVRIEALEMRISAVESTLATVNAGVEILTTAEAAEQNHTATAI